MMDVVICGDASLVGAVARSVENPVIVTDPPFNVGYHYGTYHDRMPEGEYWRWLAETLMGGGVARSWWCTTRTRCTVCPWRSAGRRRV